MAAFILISFCTDGGTPPWMKQCTLATMRSSPSCSSTKTNTPHLPVGMLLVLTTSRARRRTWTTCFRRRPPASSSGPLCLYVSAQRSDACDELVISFSLLSSGALYFLTTIWWLYLLSRPILGRHVTCV